MSGLHKRREVVSSDGNTADCEEVRCGRSPGPYVTPAEDASVDILEAYAWRFIRVSKGVQFPCESGGVDKGKTPRFPHGRALFSSTTTMWSMIVRYTALRLAVRMSATVTFHSHRHFSGNLRVTFTIKCVSLVRRRSNDAECCVRS